MQPLRGLSEPTWVHSGKQQTESGRELSPDRSSGRGFHRDAGKRSKGKIGLAVVEAAPSLGEPGWPFVVGCFQVSSSRVRGLDSGWRGRRRPDSHPSLAAFLCRYCNRRMGGSGSVGSGFPSAVLGTRWTEWSRNIVNVLTLYYTELYVLKG